MVTVSSATPAAPTVFPLVQCGSGTGDMLTVGCLATGFTPASLTFTWADQSGTALTDFVQYPAVEKNNKYTAVSQIRVRRADLEGTKSVKCVASHPAGNQEAYPFQIIETYYHLPTLNVLTSSPEEMKNKKTSSFSCFAIDFSPKQHEIKWLRNGKEISDEISQIKTSPLESNKNANGPLFSAASYLKVYDSAWLDGGTNFTCVFKNQRESVDKSVIYTKPEPIKYDDSDQLFDVNIIPLSLEEMFFNKKAELVCEVVVKQPPVHSVEWQDETGRSLIGRKHETNQGGQQKIFLAVDILYEEWTKGIDYYCVVGHDDLFDPKKIPFERKNGGVLTRPAVFLLHPVEQAKTVTLTCYVKDFYPKEVVVSWLVDDMAADSNDYASKTTNLTENNGYFFVYGQLSFSYDQWKKNGVVYSCVVYHESMMNTTRVIVRSMVERTDEKPNLVNLNMNLPETCQ